MSSPDHLATPGFYEPAPGSNVTVLVAERDEAARAEYAAVAALGNLAGDLRIKSSNGEEEWLPDDLRKLITDVAALFAQGDGTPLLMTRRPDLLETPPPKDTVGTKEIADMLGVSEPTVRRIIDSGALPAIRIGKGGRKVLRRDVAAYIERTTFGIRQDGDAE